MAARKALGRAIRSAREDMELSMGQLARAVGVTAPYICDVEHGRKGVRPAVVRRIADVVAADVGELIELAVEARDAVEFEDLNQNGVFDADDEGWLDLVYPTSSTEPFRVAAGGGLSERQSAGDAFRIPASLSGVLYTSGRFEATGKARHYGSIVARQGVVQEAGGAGTPEIYWDESIVTDWPPEDSRLPRTVITSWVTDL